MGALNPPELERDVVVERHVVEIGRLGRRRVATLGRRALLAIAAAALASAATATAALEAAFTRRATTASGSTTFAAAAEHLHVVGDDGDLLGLDEADIGVTIVINAHVFHFPVAGLRQAQPERWLYVVADCNVRSPRACRRAATNG